MEMNPVYKQTLRDQILAPKFGHIIDAAERAEAREQANRARGRRERELARMVRGTNHETRKFKRRG